MKRALLGCAVLAAATAAHARPKKEPNAPVAPPEIQEISDVRLGDTLSNVCVPAPMTCEPYDGRDNFLIVETTDHSKAFLQLAGECNFNALMFAQSIAPKSPDGCVKVGGEIVVSDSFGGSRVCRITQISKWNPEATYLHNYDESSSP